MSEKRLADLLSDDPDHVYSEDELDAIEAIDMAMALRLARVQHLAGQVALERAAGEAAQDGEINFAQVSDAIAEARAILAQDGGDIELVAIENGGVVKVRMKGACAGCPNSALDLRNIVERLVKRRVPGVIRVENCF